MAFRRNRSFSSDTSDTSADTRSDYSQPTGSERDDGEYMTINEDTQDSHFATSDKHPEASVVSVEETHSTSGNVTPTKQSLVDIITGIQLDITNKLLPAAMKAPLMEDQHHGGFQERLEGKAAKLKLASDRKAYYKALASSLDKRNKDLILQLSALKQRSDDLEKQRNELREKGMQLFA